VYNGETSRRLKTRKSKHIDAVKNFKIKKSALCQHVENDHFIAWDSAKILGGNHIGTDVVESWRDI